MRFKKKVDEPLMMEGGSNLTQWSAKELAELSSLKLHHPFSNKEGDESPYKDSPDMIRGSCMLQEKFGGMENIISVLGTHETQGIQDFAGTKTDREQQFGQNFFPPPNIKTICELIMENFDDTINIVLLVASIVNSAIGLFEEGFPDGMIEGVSIMIALLIIISVNSVNNYISELKLAKLVIQSGIQEVTVIREGKDKQKIDSKELVVGDLVVIKEGDKIAADMLLIQGQELECTEAELTGEPDGKAKARVTSENYRNGAYGVLMAKSLVVKGQGFGVVTAVGEYTEAGAIDKASRQESEQTLLQKKLETIANQIGYVGISCALLTFSSLIIRIAVEMMEFLPCDCKNILVCVQPQECKPYEFSANMESRLWKDVLGTIIISISVIVVAIPEGLPLAVTISLSYSSAKMQELQNLVRRLASSETMGGATYICSDKTGTLTQNVMTVMALYAGDTCRVEDEGKRDIPIRVKAGTQKIQVEELGMNLYDSIRYSVLWNSTAFIQDNDGKDPVQPVDKQAWMTKGNVTEQGIFKQFIFADDPETIKKMIKEQETYTQESIIEFTSKRKRATVAFRNPNAAGTDNEIIIYCKGAPDMILPLCTNIINENGDKVSIEDEANILRENQNEIEKSLDGFRGQYTTNLAKVIKSFATQAYRTILTTYKTMSADDFERLKSENNNFEKNEDRAVLESDLTVLGLFGIQDPLRRNIKDSVGICQKAGITVIMCTGDNIDTATAISLNAGLLSKEHAEKQYSCMIGEDFEREVGGPLIEVEKDASDDDEEDTPKDMEMGESKKKKKMVKKVQNMAAFRKIKENLRVIGRCSPAHKEILVTGLQDSDEVVAVTGDGTNDAPALKKADVGFAMGITGTEVAKSACDIVLLDDNFSSIIVALQYGRNVYDNVRKFLQFQLSVNVVAMFIVFFGSVFLSDSPMNAVQMLWVNLIMDTLGALALATEPPAPEILDRPPYAKHNAIVTTVMWRNVLGHSVYQVIILCIFLFSGPGWIVEHYWLDCQYDAAGKCLALNPFFTQELYENDGIQIWAEKRQACKNNEGKQCSQEEWAAKFDQKLLDKYQCWRFKEQNMEAREFVECSQLDQAGIKAIGTPDQGNKENDPTQKLIHYTYVFQVFVFMQLFNQINARKINEGEFNVFDRICANPLFLVVVIFTFAVQMILVEVGGKIVKTYPLNMEANYLCCAFGSGELIWGVLIKFVPDSIFKCLISEEKPQTQEELSNSVQLTRSGTMKKKQLEAKKKAKQ